MEPRFASLSSQVKVTKFQNPRYAEWYKNMSRKARRQYRTHSTTLLGYSLPTMSFPEDHVSAATGVVFSSSRLPESENSSLKSSPAGSIHGDAEKAHVSLEDEDKALAYYLVPALEKGQKNARLKPVNPWIKFRVWYNPYRMVCLLQVSTRIQHTDKNIAQLFTSAFTLNMIGIVVAACGKFPYAEMHGPAFALGNITASVACRNEFFIRYFLYWPLVKTFQKVRLYSVQSIS